MNNLVRIKQDSLQKLDAKLNQEEVTVQMIAEVLAVEFPEFLYPMAEENFLLGYQQGLEDAEKLYLGKTSSTEE